MFTRERACGPARAFGRRTVRCPRRSRSSSRFPPRSRVASFADGCRAAVLDFVNSIATTATTRSSSPAGCEGPYRDSLRDAGALAHQAPRRRERGPRRSRHAARTDEAGGAPGPAPRPERRGRDWLRLQRPRRRPRLPLPGRRRDAGLGAGRAAPHAPCRPRALPRRGRLPLAQRGLRDRALRVLGLRPVEFDGPRRGGASAVCRAHAHSDIRELAPSRADVRFADAG